MSPDSYNAICRVLSTEEQGFQFALAHNLIKRTGTCECGAMLEWKSMPAQKWGHIFRCTRSRTLCGKRYSMLHGSWFANSNMPIHEQIMMLYCYSLELRSGQIEAMIGVKRNAAADWQSYFRDICTIYVSEVSDAKIGGVGRVVEIDETKIMKRKNHQGRMLTAEEHGYWVFGGICRETKETFFSMVPDRSERTLVDMLLQNVHQGTTIISDCWRAYNNISRHGYAHLTINHSENFLSPEDAKIHTQTIERAWRGLKENIPKSSRYQDRLSYLIVYSFKRQVAWYDMSVKERFNLLLKLVERFY